MHHRHFNEMPCKVFYVPLMCVLPRCFGITCGWNYFLSQAIGQVVVVLLRITHNLIQLYQQNIYTSDISNLV